jgi:hypothetical protein
MQHSNKNIRIVICIIKKKRSHNKMINLIFLNIFFKKLLLIKCRKNRKNKKINLSYKLSKKSQGTSNLKVANQAKVKIHNC